MENEGESGSWLRQENAFPIRLYQHETEVGPRPCHLPLPALFRPCSIRASTLVISKSVRFWCFDDPAYVWQNLPGLVRPLHAKHQSPSPTASSGLHPLASWRHIQNPMPINPLSCLVSCDRNIHQSLVLPCQGNGVDARAHAPNC
jgi:hypothetical protein